MKCLKYCSIKRTGQIIHPSENWSGRNNTILMWYSQSLGWSKCFNNINLFSKYIPWLHWSPMNPSTHPETQFPLNLSQVPLIQCILQGLLQFFPYLEFTQPTTIIFNCALRNNRTSTSKFWNPLFINFNKVKINHNKTQRTLVAKDICIPRFTSPVTVSGLFVTWRVINTLTTTVVDAAMSKSPVLTSYNNSTLKNKL